MKNSDYWKERFKILEAASHSYGQQTYSQIEATFIQAQRDIQGEIDKWYARFAQNNGVTLADAKKLLNSKELAELKWDVNQYIHYGRQNAIDGKWMKQLENASAKFHITRLEALQLRTQQAMEKAFGNELDSVDKMARHILTENYYHSIFEVQRGFNIGWNIGQLNERELNKLVVKPWSTDGKNFSDRIWQRKQEMVGQLHRELTRTLILGKAPDEAIKHMEQFIDSKFKNTRYAAARLVMTEQAYFHSVSQEEAFNELDVEEFEIIATLDSHTSKVCQDMDGKHFPMKDYEVGVTAPPFHPFCRSVTAPWFEDNYGGMRAARDENGKTYYVPDDMTYKDWKKAVVDNANETMSSADKFAKASSSVSNNWDGADSTPHTSEELDDLKRYAEERGIKLYTRQPFDGDISLIKSEIDVIQKIRTDFNHTDYLKLGWKSMNVDDFGVTSENHQEIWINKLALRNRSITDRNLAVDNYLATDIAEGIAAHEMGHVISGKIKNGKTGLDIYKETVYNVSGKQISDDEAIVLLLKNVSRYSTNKSYKLNGSVFYDEIVAEMLSVHYTKPNEYSKVFVRLLKEACGI